jgi:hypothetical protein
MKRLAAAALLLGLALSASAQDFGREFVADPNNCPADTDASPYYKWQDGHFVRDGWVCEPHATN